jgi:uncharacterized integral membrane protein (TIGR00698 family)
MSLAATARASGLDTLRGVQGNWPGILLAVVVAVAATFVAETRGGPTLLYALLLGMALHEVSVGGRAEPGIDFAARRILRLGVALLGARITLGQLGGLGWFNGALVVGGVLATIGFGVAMSRLFGLSRRLGILTGGATAICGASAAIAIAMVLPRNENTERELIFTVAGITVLSTTAMILYPVIVTALGLAPDAAGIFLGGTIHDVAQVVGAGYSISHETGDYAVLTKMLRVAMLLPVVMLVSVAVRRGRGRTTELQRQDSLLPGFLVGFVLLVIAGTLGWIPGPLGAAMNEVSHACLVIAIAAVGLKTSLLDIRKVGLRATLLLGSEALFLVVFVLLIQQLH